MIALENPGNPINKEINSDNATSNQGEGLKREVGVWGIFINVINNTIGSGIFLLPAIVAGALGNASIFAYIACGLLFLLVMLCYAEISSQVTCSGGSYAYIEKAFGPYAGFISNTLFWFGVGVFVTAALVNGFTDILSVAFPIFNIPFYRAMLFLVLIGFSAYINIRGVKQGMKLIKLVTLIKLVPLFLLVVIGFWGSKLSNLRMDHLPSFQNLGEVSLVLFFAFAGGETALNIGGEMKNPSRTAPLGILYGMVATIVIFCFVQLAAQGVLGSDLANYKEAPLAEVADKAIGPIGHTIVIVASLVAIFGILNSLPLAFPRVMLAGAEDKLLPGYLAKIHPRFATPANAIITFSVIAFFVAVSGGFRQLAIIVSASLLLLYVGVVLATIKFRLKKKVDRPGTFKIPGGLIIPITALVALGCFIMQLQAKEIIGITVFIGVLSIIYFIRIIAVRKPITQPQN
ncbi:amino acid permease [Ginsengibacter hankyongi]|uniref:Amino acid permease n=1 Tax=Ginsengibacter hankyongi TaxID=2607284 RepID=A0A5J5IN43_9BACT|nr:APC family permease [Ginsengibacter hankyongi]KAA9042151.1 amino acid permease [Ginsengibacter hankyongi]